MKKRYPPLLIYPILILILVLICACGQQKEASVVKTYEASELGEDAESNDFIIITKHYEMSDGTWKTDTHNYKYRLEITGRMNNADKGSTFLFLSNIKDITFGQAWKAAGFSSNMADYFNEEDAKLVGMK